MGEEFTDVFVTKLNASGSGLVYSTYIGGSDDDEGYGIAVDGSGNAYVTGYTIQMIMMLPLVHFRQQMEEFFLVMSL
jgi:hypothetical protein